MSVPTITISKEKLVKLGLQKTESVHYKSTPEELIHDTLRLKDCQLTDTGALAMCTGELRGRASTDKLTVKPDITENTLHWHNFTIPIEEKNILIIQKKMMD